MDHSLTKSIYLSWFLMLRGCAFAVSRNAVSEKHGSRRSRLTVSGKRKPKFVNTSIKFTIDLGYTSCVLLRRVTLRFLTGAAQIWLCLNDE